MRQRETWSAECTRCLRRARRLTRAATNSKVRRARRVGVKGAPGCLCVCTAGRLAGLEPSAAKGVFKSNARRANRAPACCVLAAALEKALEARKREKALAKFRDTNNVADYGGPELAFATEFQASRRPRLLRVAL